MNHNNNNNSSIIINKDLVPITREFLKECYKRHPIEPPSKALQAYYEKIDIIARSTGSSSSDVWIPEPLPHKMDANIDLNRSQLEEIIALVPTGSRASKAAQAALSAWERYQEECVEKVDRTVRSFLPNDFRLSIYNAFRARSKENFQREVASLMARGGTIKQKYELIWRHQQEQRQALISMGNAGGVWRAAMSIVAGIPPALLDFVKTINDDDGPADEFRVTYGPTQYFLTRFVNRVRVVLAADAADERALRCLEAYNRAVQEYVTLLEEVLQDSPFFVSRADILQGSNKNERVEDVVVSSKHTVCVPVGEGDVLSWEFSTNKDIKFAASFEESSTIYDIHPLLLVNSHLAPVQGDFVAPCRGEVKLVFDNTYSWLTKKDLHIKTRLCNPVSSK